MSASEARVSLLDSLGGVPTTGRCSVCDSELDEFGACRRCGAVYGAAWRCPHCGSIAGLVERDGVTTCKLCGGPRLPAAAARWADDDALAALREARELERGATLRNLLAFGALGGAALIALVASLIVIVATPGFVVSSALLAAAIAPALGGLALRKRGVARRAAVAAAFDRAFLAAATRRLTVAEGELDAAMLARELGVAPDRAEQLLALLTIDDRVRTRVTEDGALAYSSADARYRVADDATDVALDEATEPAAVTRASSR